MNNIHLKYISGIFVIILIGLLSLLLVPSRTAIGTLGYASTLLSIVLAVIAILITLWDVAGQKNNIIDLKKSVEELGAVTKGLEELTKVSLKTIEENQKNLSSISKELIEAVKVINSASTDGKYIGLEKQLTGIGSYLENSKIEFVPSKWDFKYSDAMGNAKKINWEDYGIAGMAGKSMNKKTNHNDEK